MPSDPPISVFCYGKDTVGAWVREASLTRVLAARVHRHRPDATDGEMAYRAVLGALDDLTRQGWQGPVIIHTSNNQVYHHIVDHLSGRGQQEKELIAKLRRALAPFSNWKMVLVDPDKNPAVAESALAQVAAALPKDAPMGTNVVLNTAPAPFVDAGRRIYDLVMAGDIAGAFAIAREECLPVVVEDQHVGWLQFVPLSDDEQSLYAALERKTHGDVA